ncbi:MAG: hypothetical protein AAGI13_00740 [Pseudomonadota bacterium]
MLIRLIFGFCVAGSVAVAQESAFASWGTADDLELAESVSASSGTMSGNARLSVRTNTLFSAFQLIHSDPELAEAKVDVSSVDFAPVRLPRAIPETTPLRLCAEVRTINGFYEAFGSSTKLTHGMDLAKLKVKTEISKLHIDGKYGEDLMLMRGFIAADCAARRSSYYVPMFFSSKADILLAVFEIGNASIEAGLYGVAKNGGVSAEALGTFECTETRRVDRGYDCTLPVRALAQPETFDLYEVQLTVVQPHVPEPRVFRSRLTLPEFNGE